MNRLFSMNKLGVGGVVMMLVIALAAIGLGIALWSKVLTINGIVRTGTVNAEFVRAFTDDDNKQDAVDLDFYDDGHCDLPPFDDDGDTSIDEDPLDGVDQDGDTKDGEDPPGKLTSCDPKETGAEDEANTHHRYDKDVAECFARVRIPDQEPQPGSQEASIDMRNVYPSYHCTSWFYIHNNGTIPIHLHSVLINGAAAVPCAAGVAPTAYDLNGDGKPDIEICVSGLEGLQLNCPAHDPAGNNSTCSELQLHPSQTFRMDLDIHIMQTAPQGATLNFDTSVCWHQWNEEIGLCPAVSCASGAVDICIDGDGTATRFPGAFQVLAGDALSAFGAATAGRCGLDMFDQDSNGAWTFGAAGDDLHCEAPGGCATGITQGVHDLGLDCKVLDIDGGLLNLEPVSCDLDFLFANPSGGEPGAVCPSLVKWHDTNGNGHYDSGEDIVLDTNGNGIFD